MNGRQQLWLRAYGALADAGFSFEPHQREGHGITVYAHHPETGKRIAVASLVPEMHIHCEHPRIEPANYGWCPDCCTQECER